MHSLDFMTCTERQRTRLAISIPSCVSSIRQAKRTANTLEPTGGTGSGIDGRFGLIHAFLRSCSQKKEIKKRKETKTTNRGHCVQMKTKICTDNLDDILIFYFGFHSFLQSDAGVETNL